MADTKKFRVQHLRNENSAIPTKDELTYGEIAIGYKKGSEAIHIKNGADEIISFYPSTASTIVKTTYANLVTLKNSSKLVAGTYYRITDFVTTVANDPEAQSAGHAFDVIVLATDVNILQEEAFAAIHEGDTYFKDCQLNAWKVWYCLDNDTTRFQWADTTNGKGVIYRLIDEWQNDCPYDFKNVQFKRYAVTDNSDNGELVSLDGQYYGYNDELYKLTIDDEEDFKWAYTFTLIDEDDEWVDYSSKKSNGVEEDLSYFAQIKKGRCEYNLIRHLYGAVSFEDVYYQVQSLNNIVLISTMDSGLSGEMLLNTFGVGNYNMTLKDNPEQNHFGDKCYNNIAGSYGNTFGNNFQYNSFGNGCEQNSFGNNVSWNTFGNGCEQNSFGNDCTDNTFGNYCYRNSFGNSCGGNTFGNYCRYNQFGNNCYSNSFGNECNNNTFGNGCEQNSFGNSCWENSFGNNVSWNTFGNDFQNNTLGNDVQYISVLTDKVYHVNILNGTKGTSGNLLTITFETEKDYSQFAGFDSSRKLQVWVDADLGSGRFDGGTY